MRKGFLASVALVLGNTVAEAQYAPAPYAQPYRPTPQPYYQGTPNYAPVWVAQPAPMQGVPMQGMPMQGMPMQGMPMQGMPVQNVPMQNVPMQNVRMQGMPMQNMPMQGMPMQGMPVQGMPMQPAAMQQAPVYYPNTQARPVSRTGTPNYLPQGYFPAARQSAPMVVREGTSTPVPPEPVRGGATPATTASSTTTVSAPFKTVARPVVGGGPGAYFDVQPATLTQAPQEPVAYHRECNDRGYIGIDYLLAWINKGPLSTPLITTGNPLDPNPGALGQPGTNVLFGTNDIDYRMFHGVRAEVGYFVDDAACYSMDLSFFYMLPRHVRFSIASDENGLPAIGRPIHNAVENDEDVYSVSFPIVDDDNPVLIIGKSSVDARTQILGGEANGRWHSYRNRCLHTEVLAGFRTLRLEETLRIRDELFPVTEDSGLTFRGLAVSPGDLLVDEDAFLCYNQFYGFQVGGRARWEQPNFYVDVTGKVGMGVTDQRVRIEGFSGLASPFGNLTTPGGILAVATNSGEHNRQVFGVVPELGVNVGMDLCRNWRFKAGYTFLMWNGVARPGMQIDRSVNTSQVPTDQDFSTVSGPARPRFEFKEEVFFLQAFNFGLEFHF